MRQRGQLMVDKITPSAGDTNKVNTLELPTNALPFDMPK